MGEVPHSMTTGGKREKITQSGIKLEKGEEKRGDIETRPETLCYCYCHCLLPISNVLIPNTYTITPISTRRSTQRTGGSRRKKSTRDQTRWHQSHPFDPDNRSLHSLYPITSFHPTRSRRPSHSQANETHRQPSVHLPLRRWIRQR